MEEIEVKARFRADGSLIPLEFDAEGRTIRILDLGRQWETVQGRHMLVMDIQGNTYHLFFQLADQSWYWVKDINGPSSKTI